MIQKHDALKHYQTELNLWLEEVICLS